MQVKDPAGEGYARREGELTHCSRERWLEWSPSSAAPGSGNSTCTPPPLPGMMWTGRQPWGTTPLTFMGTVPGPTQGWTEVGRLRAEGTPNKGEERLPRNNTHSRSRRRQQSRLHSAGPRPFTAFPSVLIATRPKTSKQNWVRSEFQELGSTFQAKLCRRRPRRA